MRFLAGSDPTLLWEIGSGVAILLGWYLFILYLYGLEYTKKRYLKMAGWIIGFLLMDAMVRSSIDEASVNGEQWLDTILLISVIAAFGIGAFLIFKNFPGQSQDFSDDDIMEEVERFERYYSLVFKVSIAVLVLFYIT